MKIVDFEAIHIMHIVSRDLDAERETREAKALGYRDRMDLAVQRAAERCVKFTLLDDQDVPQACFGFSDSRVPGVATLWMIRTEEAKRYAKSARKLIEQFMASGVYRRIEALTRADREDCRNFALWLGFKFEGTKKAFLLDGCDVDEFALVKGA